MQPASPTGADRNRQLRRWGPIGAVVAVAAIGIIVLVTRDSGNEASSATTTSTAAAGTTIGTETTAASTEETTAASSEGTTTGATTAPAAVPFPMSFADATDKGLADTIDWGSRCDTSTGRLAVPDFFAQPC